MDLRRWLRQRCFEALYSSLAPCYDAVSRLAFAGEWAHWQAAALRFADRSPVVEIGSGTGQALAMLGRAGIPAYGIDASWSMISQARRRAPGRLVWGRAQQLPLRSASVGTLLSIFPTAYILDPATWVEAARVLVPGGRFVIVAHGWLCPDDPLRAALTVLHRLVYGGHAAAMPPVARPVSLLPALALIERTPHGFVAVYVATRPEQPVCVAQ